MKTIEVREWSNSLLSQARRLLDQISHYSESIDLVTERNLTGYRISELRKGLIQGIDQLISDVRASIESKKREYSRYPIWILGITQEGGAKFGAVDHEAETHPKDLVDGNSVEMKPVEFMTLCDRVKSRVAKGYFDSIEKRKGGAEIVYGEAWSALQKLAGDD